MRLLNLQLTNYRRFDDVYLDFPDGVTGIIGNNGSGKSSLMEAIAWTIYGASRSAKEDIISMGNGSDYCQSILALEIDSKQYEIVRQISGKNLSSKMTVFTSEAGEKITAAKGIKPCEKFLTSLIGLDQYSFETSFFAKQHQLNALSNLQSSARKQRIIKMLKIDVVDKAKDLLKKDLLEIRAKAEGIESVKLDPNELQVKLLELENEIKAISLKLTGQEELVTKTKAQFKKNEANWEKQIKAKEKYLKLRTQFQKNNSERLLFEENLTQLKSDLNDIKIIKLEYEKVEPFMKKIEVLEKELKKQDELKNNFHTFTRHKDNYERYLTEYKKADSNLKQKNIAEGKVDIEKRQLSELNYIDNLKRDYELCLEKNAALENELKHATKSYSQTEERLNNLDNLKKEERCPTCLGPIKGRLPEIKNHYLNDLQTLKERINSINNEKILLVKNLKNKKINLEKETKRKTELEKELSLSLKELEKYKEIEKSRADSKKKLDEIKKYILNKPSYNEKDHASLKTEFDKCREPYERAIVLKTKISNEVALKQKFGQIENKLLVIKNNLREIKTKGQELGFKKEKLEAAKASYNKTLSKLRESELKLKEINLIKENLFLEQIKIKKEQDKIKKQLEMLKNIKTRSKEMKSLVNCFDDFRKDLIGRVRPALSQKASSLITQLTDGRYNRLELTSDYDIVLYDRNQKYAIDRFSGGEKDLANLCLRIAISELMAESSRSDFNFIILDEVIGSQDKIRKSNIIKALQALSKRFRQLFVITHVEDIKTMVDTIIEVKEKSEDYSSVHIH